MSRMQQSHAHLIEENYRVVIEITGIMFTIPRLVISALFKFYNIDTYYYQLKNLKILFLQKIGWELVTFNRNFAFRIASLLILINILSLWLNLFKRRESNTNVNVTTARILNNFRIQGNCQLTIIVNPAKLQFSLAKLFLPANN